MIATIVDTTALWQTVLASAAAGIGVAAVFSMAIVGATRFGELNRDGRTAAAIAFGLLAVVAVLVTAGAIVAGVVVMASK